MAARAALRTLPLAITAALELKDGGGDLRRSFETQPENAVSSFDNLTAELVTLLFRASALIVIGESAPFLHDEKSALRHASFGKAGVHAAQAIEFASTSNQEHAEFTAIASASSRAISDSAFAITAHAVTQHAFVANRAAVESVGIDARRIMDGIPRWSFLEQPIWPQGTPSALDDMWQLARKMLLELDMGFDAWVAWYNGRLAGKPLNYDLWRTIPEDIWKQDAKTVNAYIRQLTTPAELKPLNRVRAIFLGHPNAGKSSVIDALHDIPVVEGQKKMTPGVAITEPDITWREQPAGDGRPLVYYWDFGGQVMAHQTHQFFLRSNCLYVIVLDGRDNFEATDQARYWLEHVRAFGMGSPVLIVGNKLDLAPVWVDLAPLERVYDNIVGFFSVSCTEALSTRKTEFDAFRAAFEAQLPKVLRSQVFLTPAQLKLIDDLRAEARTETFLERSRFSSMCKAADVGTSNDGLDEASFLNILDELGVIVRFDGLRALHDLLLSPEWLTKGVYTILYSKLATDQVGRLHVDDVLTALKEKEVLSHSGKPLLFDEDRTRFLTDAMRAFKLCYVLPEDENHIIIPALLPSNEPPGHGFDLAKAWSLRWRFEGLMPQHVFPSLVVDRHGDIATETGRGDLVWRFGAILRPRRETYEASAFIEVIETHRTLTIHLNGPDARDYAGVLRESVRRALARMAHIEAYEEVGLTPDMLVDGPHVANAGLRSIAWAPFEHVRESLKVGIVEYVGPDAQRYDPRRILNQVSSIGPSTEALAKTDEAIPPPPRFARPHTHTGPQVELVRIFLSSPSDVGEERRRARALIKETISTNTWLRGRFKFDVVSWDDETNSVPMSAPLTPQKAIELGLPKPSQCQIVIVVLWSKMGTVLPPDYVKWDKTRYRSGTEWEFEDAIAQINKPGGTTDVWIYRRTEEPTIKLMDPDRDDKVAQFQELEAFFKELEHREGDKALFGSVNKYSTPDAFERMVNDHIHSYGRRRLDARTASPGPGIAGVISVARHALLGLERKPPVDRVRELAELRRRLNALTQAEVEASTPEMREVLQTYWDIVQSQLPN
jgi:GTPase SAR1 family protein